VFAMYKEIVECAVSAVTSSSSALPLSAATAGPKICLFAALSSIVRLTRIVKPCTKLADLLTDMAVSAVGSLGRALDALVSTPAADAVLALEGSEDAWGSLQRWIDNRDFVRLFASIVSVSLKRPSELSSVGAVLDLLSGSNRVAYFDAMISNASAMSSPCQQVHAISPGTVTISPGTVAT
jgi:hypothetical protein